MRPTVQQQLRRFRRLLANRFTPAGRRRRRALMVATRVGVSALVILGDREATVEEALELAAERVRDLLPIMHDLSDPVRDQFMGTWSRLTRQGTPAQTVRLADADERQGLGIAIQGIATMAAWEAQVS